MGAAGCHIGVTRLALRDNSIGKGVISLSLSLSRHTRPNAWHVPTGNEQAGDDAILTAVSKERRRTLSRKKNRRTLPFPLTILVRLSQRRTRASTNECQKRKRAYEPSAYVVFSCLYKLHHHNGGSDIMIDSKTAVIV